MKEAILRELSERDRGPIALLALVVLVFFLPALAAPDKLIWPNSGFGSDLAHRQWPDLIGYAAHWRAGRFPLWDSLVALGRPLPGDPGVGFAYPFDALFMFLPPAFAFNTLDAAHIFLAGLFTFFFLRKGYGVGRPAALAGALTYAFAPKLIAHLAGGHIPLVWSMAWAPAVLLGLKLAFDGSWRAAALAGLALAVQLPLMIQMSHYTGAAASAMWLAEVARSALGGLRGERGAWRRVGRLTVIYGAWLVWLALLGAYVFLPLAELMPYNSRAGFTLDDANLYALPPYLLLTLLAPAQFQFPEWIVFAGVVPSALCGLCLIRNLAVGRQATDADRRVTIGFFASLSLFALIYGLGTNTPLFALTNAVVPGFGLFRVPTRWWLLGELGVAVLASFGVDALIDPHLRDWMLGRRRWLPRAFGIYLIGGLTTLAVYFALFRSWHWQLARQLITATLLAGLGLAWLHGRVEGRALQWALIPVLLFDLLPLDAGYIRLVNPDVQFLRSSPALDFVASQPDIFRVYSPAGDLSYAVAAERGVESLEGLLSFQVGHAVEAIRNATGCERKAYATAVPICLYDRVPIAVPDAERLGRLNVKYVLTQTPLTAPGFKLVMPGSPAVYENEFWQERVRLTPQPPLPTRSATSQSGEEAGARILSRAPGEYVVEVTTSAPAQLVLVEAWLPGWQAWEVERRRRLEVERVEGALIGVTLEAGDHTIHFKYSPLGWRIGWPVSLVSLVGLAGWMVIAARRRAWARG